MPCFLTGYLCVWTSILEIRKELGLLEFSQVKITVYAHVIYLFIGVASRSI